MAEAKKNANLLEEYHSLYELQRHRLEGQIVALTGEKELWSGAAYNLALKVEVSPIMRSVHPSYVRSYLYLSVLLNECRGAMIFFDVFRAVGRTDGRTR